MKKIVTGVMLILLSSTAKINAQSAVDSKTAYVETGGRKLAYRSIGQGDPIILVNRFRGTLDTWDPLFLNKLAEKHRVITFDYTGIGYSTGTLPTNITDVAKDVKDIAAHLKLKKVTLLGWSYGGLVAQVAALDHPDLVSHVILLGTGPVGKRTVPLDKTFLDAALKPINDFEDEVVLFFEPESQTSRQATKASHDRIAKRLDVSKIPSRPEVFDLYFKGGEGIAQDKDNYRGKLIASTIPFLAISGDHDTSFAIENWYPLTRQLQTTQLIMLPRTGHAPHHQDPELVVSYIETFLAIPFN